MFHRRRLVGLSAGTRSGLPVPKTGDGLGDTVSTPVKCAEAVRSALSYRNQNGYKLPMKTKASIEGSAARKVTKPARGSPGARGETPAKASRTRQRPARAENRSGFPLAPWSEAEKSRFLRLLTRAGQFDAAVRLLGRPRASAFAERVRDPAFALAWDEALDCELEVLETRLIARALESASPSAASVPMSADMRAADRLALKILAQCRAPARAQAAPAPRPKARGQAAPDPAAVAGTSDVGAPKPGPADPAALRAEIDSLFEEVVRRIGAAEAKAARTA